MKVLLRILIILLAAGLVVGATYAVTQIPAVQSSIASRGGEHHGPPTGMSEDTATVATSTQVRPQRGEGGQSGGNLAGLGEVVKTLVVVLVVSLAIAAAGRVAKRVRPQRRARVVVA